MAGERLTSRELMELASRVDEGALQETTAVRLTAGAETALQKVAMLEDRSVSDIVRRAVRDYIQEYARSKVGEQVSEEIAKQARQIYADLPDSELGADDAVQFRMIEGDLTIKAVDTGALYRRWEHGDATAKIEIGDPTYVTMYRSGREIEHGTIEDGEYHRDIEFEPDASMLPGELVAAIDREMGRE